MSRWTLEVARRNPRFRVVALQDPDPRARESLGTEFGIDRRHASFEDLLTKDVDFVILNSPNDQHLPQVRRAAAAGKPCLVQKPAGRNAKEAEEMARLSRKHRVPIGVTMMELGNPLWIDVREMIRRGVFGEPVLVQACHAHDLYLRRPPGKGDWRRASRRVGGAAFIQLAVHHLNLASWILGRRITGVQSGQTSGHTVFRGDETTVATVSFAGGAIGSFFASYATSAQQFAVQGTEGYLRFFGDRVLIRGKKVFSGEVLRYRTPGRERETGPISSLPGVARLRSTRDVHNQFALWLRGEAAYPCPIESAVQDLRVVDAVYRSLRTGCREKV